MNRFHRGPVVLYATVRPLVFSLRVGRYLVGVRTHPNFVILTERYRLRPGWHFKHVGPLCFRVAREP